MKRILLSSILILTISLVSMGNNIVAKGQSNSAFGAYKIEAIRRSFDTKQQRTGSIQDHL